MSPWPRQLSKSSEQKECKFKTKWLWKRSLLQCLFSKWMELSNWLLGRKVLSLFTAIKDGGAED
ncbi:uncharacterized protein LOC100277749 [Zea mays]|uniref:Uncharacterized protein n=1 Tax=Zea mays TaxID=4577 RepID=B6TZK7_MAIZE|nr:uncharacterized protein LOC100277749 [Zea mays]ACG42540.1 hypothetical protein [Zea mays]